MKTCQICGRNIKTGSKYCWEHRHTSQAESFKGEKLIKEAEDAYISFRLGDTTGLRRGNILRITLDKIKNRDEEYINFIKEYVARIKEEKEFKKSLLK